MDDNTPMPFGIHKGKKLANVPADYLIWLYRQKTIIGLMQYIEDNEESLIKESSKYSSLNGEYE